MRNLRKIDTPSDQNLILDTTPKPYWEKPTTTGGLQKIISN